MADPKRINTRKINAVITYILEAIPPHLEPERSSKGDNNK